MLKRLKSKLQTMKSASPESETAAAKPSAGSEPKIEESAEDALEETGTFMLDVSMLKDCEDLDDLLNDI